MIQLVGTKQVVFIVVLSSYFMKIQLDKFFFTNYRRLPLGMTDEAALAYEYEMAKFTFNRPEVIHDFPL